MRSSIDETERAQETDYASVWAWVLLLLYVTERLSYAKSFVETDNQCGWFEDEGGGKVEGSNTNKGPKE
jgi:hypothetical protein